MQCWEELLRLHPRWEFQRSSPIREQRSSRQLVSRQILLTAILQIQSAVLVVSVLSNSGEPKPFSVKSGICSSCGALQRRRESWLRTVSPRPLTAVALRAHGSIQKSNGRGRTPACGEPKRVRACTSKCIRMQYGSTATGSTPSIAERRCSTALCPVCHKVCRLNNLFTSVR